MDININDILGFKEVSELLNIHKTTLANYIKRYDDFPKPIKVLASTSLYSSKDIVNWVADNNNRIMNSKDSNRKRMLKVPLCK